MYLDILHVLIQSFQSKQRSPASFRNIFAMSEVRVHSYVSYSQSQVSTKNFCLQYSLRYYSTFERVVNALGLFRSSSFISVLTFSLFGLRNHQCWGKAYVHASNVLCLSRIKHCSTQLFTFSYKL